MRTSHLDRILGRVEDLDTLSLQTLVQRLAKERRLLETIFDAVHEGIVIIDANGLTQYANKAAQRMIGLNPEDLGSAHLWKFIPPLAKAVESGGLSVLSFEAEILYPEKRFIRLHSVPFVSEEESAKEQFAVILSDITQDKILTEELLEDQKLSSIFMLAAGVAHELGNPLNSINIHLQLIERQLKKLGGGSEELVKIRESLASCQDEVSRLDSIIENFLSAIRPSAPVFEEANIYTLLDETLANQSQLMEDLGIQVELLFDAALPKILADPTQVKQVFYNVIKNAAEAMDSGGMLKIYTEVDEENLYFHFEDTGSGIDAETMAHIFEPYFSTKPTGHGLGMMIVHRIMRGHGGAVHIKSGDGPVGTRVTLEFPLKEKRQRMLEGV